MQEGYFQNINSHCRRVYSFIADMAEVARQRLAASDGEKTAQCSSAVENSIETLEFVHKVIEQLRQYADPIAGLVADSKLNLDCKNNNQKKDVSVRKSIFSLKKEKDEELTQDEFLEIYKIDMTEDLGTPYPLNKLRDDADDSLSTISERKKSEDNDNSSDLIDQLLDIDGEDTDVGDLNAVDILNGITGSSDIYSSESEHSTFSCDTLVLNRDCADKSESTKDVEEVENVVVQGPNEVLDGGVKSEVDGDYNLRECSVVLSDCNKELNDNEMHGSGEIIDNIERLINLDILNRKRKSPDDIGPSTSAINKVGNESPQKKRKDDDNKDTSDGSTTDCEMEVRRSLSLDDTKDIHKNETNVQSDASVLLKLILDCMSDPSSLLESNSDSSTDIDKNKKVKKEKLTKDIADVVEDVTETKDEDVDDLIVITDNTQVDEKKKKKSKWRRNKLLTEKLGIDSTDDEKENDPNQKSKRKPLRKSRRKSVLNNGVDADHEASSSKSDYSDSDIDNLSIVDLIISSDSSSSSDIEFINNEEKRDDKQNEGDEVKAGRRNIRTVQSDAELAESTKKAQKEEEDRRERLLSQTQSLLEISNDRGLVLDVDKCSKQPVVVVDEKITNRLKPHQRDGVRFMWNTCYESLAALKSGPGAGCILAHCMGLGKTLQVVTLIHTLFSHKNTDTKRVLVVCPLSTVPNWDNEFSICLDIAEDKLDIKRFLIIDGRTKENKHKIVLNWYQSGGVLIVGYESFQSLLNVSKSARACSVPKKVVEALLDPGPDLVICDEGHLIKNGKINRTKTLAKIRTKRRIILTGTPMQNNLTEYYYMVDFVKPNLLGTKKEFSNRFINPIVNGGYENSTETDIKLMRHRSHVLHEFLKDTIQRYEMSELVRYLPEKLDYVIFVPLHYLQAELYEAYMKVVKSSGTERKTMFFNDYFRFRDIWAHPCILVLKGLSNKRNEVDTISVEPDMQDDVPDEWWQSICPDDILTEIEYGPKMKIMLEIIEQSVKLNDKVLIFGSHLAELDAIEFFLKDKGWQKNKSYLRMDGTLAPHKRMEYCNRFNSAENHDIKLFLLSQKIGGLGLNLVAANRIILMDVNFNPAIDNQSLFRCFRFGQEKRVHVYRLVSIGTMEEVIYERSITKQAVSLRVVDEHQISRHYTSNDLQALYRFKSYADEQRPIPKRPADDVLAAILDKCKEEIFKYQDHQDLLENRPEEQLDEEEQRLAWVEFRKEQEAAYQRDVAINNQRAALNQQLQSASNVQPTVAEQPLPVPPPVRSQPPIVRPEIVFVDSEPPRAQTTAAVAALGKQSTNPRFQTPPGIVPCRTPSIVRIPTGQYRVFAPRCRPTVLRFRPQIPQLRPPVTYRGHSSAPFTPIRTGAVPRIYFPRQNAVPINRDINRPATSSNSVVDLSINSGNNGVAVAAPSVGNKEVVELD